MQLYECLGKPLDNIPTIHIGGTNGKGTTAWKVAKCTQGASLKTGLFVSPHNVGLLVIGILVGSPDGNTVG